MIPTIGRIVLYQVAEQKVLPAIVVAVREAGSSAAGGPLPLVDLEVFGTPPSERFVIQVCQGQSGMVGTWHWPPRVP